MEEFSRLDTLVAKVLADVRQRMIAGGTADEAAPPLAQRTGGELHARNGDAHPRSSSRSIAKRATGMAAKTSMIR
jgi:hypothetical protein